MIIAVNFQFKQLERKSLKKLGLQPDSNPWPPRYRCNVLPTELWSHTLGARSICDCESVYSSSSTVKQTSETLRKKINPVPLICFIPVDFIHGCHYRCKKRKTDFGQSIWPPGDQLTTAFTIPNCLEHEFLKCFLVQGWQQSFWKGSILSNIPDFQWCLHSFTTVRNVY